jgi:hypothetical protein
VDMKLEVMVLPVTDVDRVPQEIVHRAPGR